MVLKVTELSKNELSSLILGALGEIFSVIEGEGNTRDVNDLVEAILNGQNVRVWALNPKYEGQYGSYLINISDIKRGFNKAIKSNSYNLSFFMDEIERTSVCCECIMQYIIYGKIMF